MVKSITHNLNYYLSIGNSLEVAMYLLKLQMHKHGNSIYFMHDNMVCFQNPVTNVFKDQFMHVIVCIPYDLYAVVCICVRS